MCVQVNYLVLVFSMYWLFHGGENAEVREEPTADVIDMALQRVVSLSALDVRHACEHRTCCSAGRSRSPYCPASSLMPSWSTEVSVVRERHDALHHARQRPLPRGS